MPARILVIEDTQASLQLLVDLLEAFGFTPLTAENGLRGLEAARRERPDLILCDIQMPIMNGIEVCRALKADDATRAMPIIALTAFAMKGDDRKLLDEGFDGYISKPIDPTTFLGQLAPFLQEKPAPPRLPATDTSVVEEPRGECRATILVADNTPSNLLLMQTILAFAGFEVVTADSPRAALGLLRTMRPDMILSDVHMPDGGGFALITVVKADPALASIPFIFISSSVWGKEERLRGMSLGADRFIMRPIEPEALLSEVETCLARADVASDAK